MRGALSSAARELRTQLPWRGQEGQGRESLLVSGTWEPAERAVLMFQDETSAKCPSKLRAPKVFGKTHYAEESGQQSLSPEL